jgi:hypothetical protein
MDHPMSGANPMCSLTGWVSDVDRCVEKRVD